MDWMLKLNFEFLKQMLIQKCRITAKNERNFIAIQQNSILIITGNTHNMIISHDWLAFETIKNLKHLRW